MRNFIFAVVVAVLNVNAGIDGVAHAEPTYGVNDIVQLALESSPGLSAASAQKDAVNAGIEAARAYPNPTVDGATGPTRARQPGTSGDGRSWQVLVTQPIDYPWLRSARKRGAQAGGDAANADFESYRINLIAQVKTAFYAVLRRRDEYQIAHEDADLLRGMRDGIKVRVDTGEAPRFDLIRADAELLNASKAEESAELRVAQARASLIATVGPALARDFELTGELPQPVAPPSLDALRDELLARSPAFDESKAGIAQAEANLDLQKRSRFPDVAVHAGVNQDPDQHQTLVGMSVSLPLWDHRSGQVNAAHAQWVEAHAHDAELRNDLTQEMEIAYQQYLINSRQVATFENGLLTEAEAALKVAEAAYRYGERGILDYLDAQRVYRGVRLDYLNARYELQNSLIEIDRLRAVDREGAF